MKQSVGSSKSSIKGHFPGGVLLLYEYAESREVEVKQWHSMGYSERLIVQLFPRSLLCLQTRVTMSHCHLSLFTPSFLFSGNADLLAFHMLNPSNIIKLAQFISGRLTALFQEIKTMTGTFSLVSMCFLQGNLNTQSYINLLINSRRDKTHPAHSH